MDEEFLTSAAVPAPSAESSIPSQTATGVIQEATRHSWESHPPGSDHESQATLRSLIDSTTDLIWSVDPVEHGLRLWNRGLEEYFLKERGIALRVGMRPEELFPADAPHFIERWHEFYAEAVRSASFTCEYQAFSATRVLELTFHRLESDGQVFGISVFGKDATARKTAEATLRHSEARLRALIRILQYRAQTVQEFLDHSLNEAIALTESRIGYIYFYDEDHQQFILNSWSKDVMKECAVMNPQTCYELAKTGFWGEVVRQRKPVMLNQFQAGHPLKKGYPEGHVPLKRFMSIPVFKDDRIVAVVGVGNKGSDYDETDVLQLTLLMDNVWKWVDIRQAEQRLREANQHYFTVASCVPDTIWSMDLSGRLIYISPNVERTHGWTVEEALKISRRETTTPDQASLDDLFVARELEKAQAPDYDRNRILTFESEQLRKDGTTFWAEIRLSFIWSEDGNPVGFTGITRDITERKKAEAERERLWAQLSQAQKMESVGRLAGGIAHDFNNLLTVINGYSQMTLKKMNTADPLRLPIDQIHRAGERAAGLTRQLLAFSRKQILEPRVLNLNQVMAEMQQLLLRLVGEDVELRVEFSPENLTVLADPHQLEQVIMNLAVNARDAMPHGGRLLLETVLITQDEGTPAVEPDLPPGRYALLQVSDTGVGMDEAAQQRIFEPFYTTKEAGKGTGLGLSMVQGIVAQSGGYLTLESKPEHGTTFRVYLPLLAEAGEKPQPSVAAAHAGTGTILVVEDQADVLEYATAVLREYGYQVLQAASADEAISLFASQGAQIDLVLTDVVMPNLSGRELLAHLARMRPEIKALFMSGYSEQFISHHGILDQSIQFLQKPFTPDALAKKVNAMLAPGK